jgi:hypothetical protein
MNLVYKFFSEDLLAVFPTEFPALFILNCFNTKPLTALLTNISVGSFTAKFSVF